MNWKSRMLLLALCTTVILPARGQHLYFERVTGLSESPSTPIHGIAKDSIGYIWFGSWNGVYRYDGKTFDEFRHTLENPYSLPNNRIRNLIADADKNVWLLTFNRQYVHYKSHLQRFEVVPENQVPERVSTLLNRNASRLNRNKHLAGKAYYLHAHRLVEQDLASGKTYTYTATPNLPGGLRDAYITSYFIDDQDILWLGTRSGDIYKANTHRKPFHIHRLPALTPENADHTPVRSLLKNGDELWLGTHQNGVLVVPLPSANTARETNQHLSTDAETRTLFKDSRGSIWMGGIYGLQRRNPSSGEWQDILSRTTHPSLRIHSVYAVSEFNQSLWAGLYNGLARISTQTGEIERLYDLSVLIQFHSVMDMMWDPEHNLWLATEGNGLLRLTFSADGELTDTLQLNSRSSHLTTPFMGDMAYSLYQDKAENLWVATTDGLFKIDPSTLETVRYSMTDGLPDNYIAAVTGDAEGNLWISHKKGISKLEQPGGSILNFHISDRNEDWTFMDKALLNDTTTNILYFGARDGYVSFRPDAITENPFPPKLVFKHLFIAGKKINAGDVLEGKIMLRGALSQVESLELSYPNRDFSLEMATLHFDNPRDNVLMYQLEGYNPTWLSTTQNTLAFTRVPPGNYVLKAKALSPDHVESATIYLPIVIRPPWYLSTAAKAGYLVLLLAVIILILRFLLYRERLKNALQLEKIKAEKQEELNRQKLDFFTNVSHDLRTPLTLIADPIRQLQKNKVAEEKRGLYLDMIARNIDRLTGLINQLLDFRKADAGKLTPHFTTEDVVEIIRESLQPFEYKAQERGISFTFATPMSECVVETDRDKVQQVVTNLVSNALKYTPDHGAVQVSLHRNVHDNELCMTVKDNGVGMEKQALKNIFEPFNNEGAKPFYGNSSGMGLAITHKLVETLQGKITISSTPHKGTKVQVFLPFVAPVSDWVAEDTAAPLAPTTHEKPTAKKPLVLLVEDSEDVLTYLKTELEKKYEILTETNGLNGLKAALKKVPDLVISDVMMPKMDGISLCEKIKNNEQTSHIPVILLTAKTSEESHVEGLHTGADMYISKPFNMEVLKAQVQSLLENRKRLQTRSAKTPYISDLSKGENRQDNAFLQKAMKAVQQHLDNPELNPDLLAEKLHLSRRQLYRKLEAISGSTVQDFIVRVRMEKAADLLQKSDLNVSQIADKLGFSEASNFSRTFTKHFGQSPSKFRKAHSS